MGKVEQGIINIRDKYGDAIIVKGSRKQAHTRKPVKAIETHMLPDNQKTQNLKPKPSLKRKEAIF